MALYYLMYCGKASNRIEQKHSSQLHLALSSAHHKAKSITATVKKSTMVHFLESRLGGNCSPSRDNEFENEMFSDVATVNTNASAIVTSNKTVRRDLRLDSEQCICYLLLLFRDTLDFARLLLCATFACSSLDEGQSHHPGSSFVLFFFVAAVSMIFFTPPSFSSFYSFFLIIVVHCLFQFHRNHGRRSAFREQHA